jgi:2-polyprenyl-6-hydroxyphenyl methylase/3-demethylubiquinone-9 3-methyltransferase
VGSKDRFMAETIAGGSALRGKEAREGPRFDFGANWRRFLSVVTLDRVSRAEASLLEMLEAQSLRGKRMLDIGCGSGLFSLAAHRLGAQVLSFDFDSLSAACAEELKRLHAPASPSWRIAQGSVLDADFMDSLGRFDVVYSWGVLHHTGDMWKALEHACGRVDAEGRLFIAIYNDQGIKSRCWWHVKRIYNWLPRVLRPLYLFGFAVALETGALAVALLRRQPSRFIKRWTDYQSVRGMSRWHDIVDWIGGFPFEVATPQAVIGFCQARGFTLERLKTSGGRMGCNEFVFKRTDRAAPSGGGSAARDETHVPVV